MLGDSSRAIYRDLIAQKTRVPEAWEGLGMLALRDQQTDEARKDFAAAMEAGAKSAACYMEYARLEADNAKAIAALERAAKINPKLAEPHFLMAQRQTDPRETHPGTEGGGQAGCAQSRPTGRRWPKPTWTITTFRKPRRPGNRPSRPPPRPAIAPACSANGWRWKQQRLDWEDAEKKRKADEEAREIERLKQQARAESPRAGGARQSGPVPRSAE